MDSEARLIEIETRLAFQDRTIEALNEVVLSLREDLRKLHRELAETRERLDNGGPEIGPSNEAPPHW